MILAAFIMLLVVIVFLCIFMYALEQTHQSLQEQWRIERKELIDRMHSTSFAEYKQAEVRVIKAQKDEKPEPKFHLE